MHGLHQFGTLEVLIRQVYVVPQLVVRMACICVCKAQTSASQSFRKKIVTSEQENVYSIYYMYLQREYFMCNNNMMIMAITTRSSLIHFVCIGVATT